MYDRSNVFAKILRKELPCNCVYEDDFVLSIYDINPIAKTHVLVIVKGEYIDFDDFVSNASSDAINGYFNGINKTLDTLGIKDSGYRLIMNTGKNGSQEVMHLHAHILGGENLGWGRYN